MVIRIEEVAGIDFSDVAGRIGAVTPGEVLRDEFMKPLGLSGRALARELGVSPNRITAILAGQRAVTAETAILLAQALRHLGRGLTQPADRARSGRGAATEAQGGLGSGAKSSGQ